MKYKVVKEVELDKKVDSFVDTSAQCILQLLVNRLCVDEDTNYEADDNFDIDFNFSMYGPELKQIKKDLGYTNDKFIESADSFVRKLL